MQYIFASNFSNIFWPSPSTKGLKTTTDHLKFKIEISRQQIWDTSPPCYLSWCFGHSPTKTTAHHATSCDPGGCDPRQVHHLMGLGLWKIHTKITKWQPNQLPLVVWHRIQGTSSVSWYPLQVFLFYCTWDIPCANRFHWKPQEVKKLQGHDDTLLGPVFQSCILRWSAHWNRRQSFHEKDSSKSMVSA